MNKITVEGKTYTMEQAVKSGILKPTRHVDDKLESLEKRRGKGDKAD